MTLAVVLMRWMVSPRLGFRTRTAIRSEDSKLVRIYSAGEYDFRRFIFGVAHGFASSFWNTA